MLQQLCSGYCCFVFYEEPSGKLAWYVACASIGWVGTEADDLREFLADYKLASPAGGQGISHLLVLLFLTRLLR